MSHPDPTKAPVKGAPVKAPIKGAAAPAGRGGSAGSGGIPLARGSGAAPAGGEGGGAACVSCKEDTGGAKFCPKCGTLQPGQGGPAKKIGAVGPATLAGEEVDWDTLKKKFEELCATDTENQTEVFLKGFIMALGDDWKQLLKLQAQFQKMLRDEGESNHDMNEVQAMTFLQRNGAERTSTQRRDEIRDMDMLNSQRVCFIVYLLIHYKVMILTEYYKRKNTAPLEDLSKNGVGLIGVGPKLVEQLFAAAPAGTLPPELEKAIEEFTTMMRERNRKLDDLQAKSKGASVKAMAAANEIKQMEAEDPTEMNRLEITLNAAKKKALKSGTDGEKVLAEKKKLEIQKEEENRRASRNRLKEKTGLWEGKE